ncbi:MAG: NADH-quinone oxidoreductase subunit C, partial [Burkholderiales bacterium]|nr:NADH-quinone oxidoreductase subunit C [Burkholderiales bacterium]
MAELDLPVVHHLGSAPPVWQAPVDAAQWRLAAERAGRLVALWGVGPGLDAKPARTDAKPARINAALGFDDGLLWVELEVPPEGYPDLARLWPCATRMQRAAADLYGVQPADAQDRRPWLDHGRRPEHPAAADYDFVRVEGEGVHEIAVGPVHAGIIEPGHFRFSVVGEKVLRLEQRLGYTHKGVERRYTELAPLEAHRLAGRASGDSTVAGAWAYCMALETAAGVTPPPRALALRATLLERERIANHLGDLGALGNDAAFAFGLAQFSRLRELWQRLSKEAFGHRLMMDAVVPGGVACDLDGAMVRRQYEQCDAIEAEVRELRRIYYGHAGMQDRFISTGRVDPELAARLGLTGLAGRASGQARDLRCDQRWPPYDRLAVRPAVHAAGDVASRVAVRFEEVLESLRLIRALADALP